MHNKKNNSWFYLHILSAIIHPKNFLFCLKYPFWKQTNALTGRFMGYESTWYDEIPGGWKKAFGKQLSEDIVKAFKESKIAKRNWFKSLVWSDIKEKWGSLRLSAASAPDKVGDVLDKYEYLSEGYCISCGKPARYLNRSGWVHFACKDCFRKELNDWKKYNPKLTDADIKKELRRCRLQNRDICHTYRYENGQKILIDLKKEYGIDFEDLWGLK